MMSGFLVLQTVYAGEFGIDAKRQELTL